MIQLTTLISNHGGAGERFLKRLCAYADQQGKTIILSADSTIPKFGIKGSRLKDKKLVDWYSSYGFIPSIKPYYEKGKRRYKNIMERPPQC